MKDVPGGETASPDQADMIIHAALVKGDDFLMASDDPTAETFGPVQGMMVTYEAPDVPHANRVFDALADGGTITHALQPTFFPPAFGTCIDRVGPPWMTVAPPPQQPS